MKVKIKLIGVNSQGKLSGAPSCVPSNLTALTKDQNLTQKIELGSVNKFYIFFSYYQILSYGLSYSFLVF